MKSLPVHTARHMACSHGFMYEFPFQTCCSVPPSCLFGFLMAQLPTHTHSPAPFLQLVLLLILPLSDSPTGEPVLLDEESVMDVSEEELEQYLVKLSEYLVGAWQTLPIQ